MVEDTLAAKYSIHPGDGGRQYVSNGKHTVWLNDAEPVTNNFDIYMDGDETFVSDGVDETKTQWCKELFKQFEEPSVTTSYICLCLIFHPLCKRP